MNELQPIKRFLSAKEASKHFGVSSDTLRRWDKFGIISSIRTNPLRGHRRYDVSSFKEPRRNVANVGIPSTPESEQPKLCTDNSTKNIPTGSRDKVCYCRVSSKHQKSDLDNQISSFKETHPGYEIISDVGSGIDFKRKGFQRMLQGIFTGVIKEVVVAHRDRLCRFAFDLMQWICEVFHVKLVVLDISENDPNEDLCKDVMSILHVFSCRINGRRRYYTKPRKEEYKENEEIKESS